MRRCILLIGIGIAVLSGCGTGNQPTNIAPIIAPGRGAATVTIVWPARGRLIPAASNSVNVVITQGSTVVGQHLLVRPLSSGPTTGTFDLLPTGTLSAAAAAYPNTDGSGTAQASATVPVVIQANQTTNISLTMNSTIDHLEITPAAPTVTVQKTILLTATAKNSSGAVVLLASNNLQWSADNSGNASVNAAGVVTGIRVGNASITAREAESGKAVTVVVTVAPPIVSNPFLADPFAYPAGSAVLGQNGGTGTWGGAWNEYGQGYTSSVISSAGLTFPGLMSSGNAIQTTSDFPVGHARQFGTSPGKTGGVLFMSCLQKPLDSLNVGYPSTYFELVYGGVSIGKGGSSNFYGLENSGGGARVDSTVPVVPGQTVFLVVRITFGPVNGNDTVDLFINPTPGQPLPAVPNATKSDRNTGVPGDFNFGSSIRCMFDEIRFGRTFDDVAPPA